MVAVAAGELHSVALKNDGTVVAWGNNADGETNVPAGLSNVVAIAAGYSHNLALKSDGTVAAWGFNGNGQTNVPFGLTNIMAIAAGGYHCLALRMDGTVVFWGDSSSGQTNFIPANLNNVFTIAGGGFHTLTVSALYDLNVTNTPPYWTNGLDGTTITMDEMTSLSVTNAARDSNSPPQLVFYSPVNLPPWASIDAFSGVITFNPQEADGPANVVITTVATDNGYPPLSATNSFTLIVNEVNRPPVFLYPTNTTVTNISALLPFTVSCVATDYDIPVNPLTFALVSATSLAGQTITNLSVTTNGLISWTPTAAQSPSTNLVLVSVTDTNVYALTNQSYSVTNSFTIIVTAAPPPPAKVFTIISTNIGGTNGFLLTWFAPSNDLFQVQWTATSRNQLADVHQHHQLQRRFLHQSDEHAVQLLRRRLAFPFGPTRFYRLILFTPPPAAVAFAATLPATLVTGVSAQLNGFATPNGFPSAVWFEWGATRYYGSTTTPADVGSGNSRSVCD